MPGVGIGVYTGYEGVINAGDEVSSTYEGRHITVLEQNLIHPNHLAVGLNLVQKGDPVIICNTVALGGSANYGNAVGVALATATAITDLIAVDTEGIWQLPVSSYTDGAAGSAIVAGDPLFIHDESLAIAGALGLGDALISKITNLATQVPFGYALGTMVAAGTGTIAVKVHFDPSVDNALVRYNTVLTGASGKETVGILAAGHSENITQKFTSQVDGQQDGLTYGAGSWMELGANFIATGTVTTPWDAGIYSGAGADLTAARLIFGAQYMAILDSVPLSYYPWRINVSAGSGSITALIQAGNIQSVGYIAAVTEAVAPIGYIPLAFIAGIAAAQPCYVRVYTGTA